MFDSLTFQGQPGIFCKQNMILDPHTELQCAVVIEIEVTSGAQNHNLYCNSKVLVKDKTCARPSQAHKPVQTHPHVYVYVHNTTQMCLESTVIIQKCIISSVLTVCVSHGFQILFVILNMHIYMCVMKSLGPTFESCAFWYAWCVFDVLCFMFWVGERWIFNVSRSVQNTSKLENHLSNYMYSIL